MSKQKIDQIPDNDLILSGWFVRNAIKDIRGILIEYDGLAGHVLSVDFDRFVLAVLREAFIAVLRQCQTDAQQNGGQANKCRLLVHIV